MIPLDRECKPFTKPEWDKVNNAIGESHIRILTDYETFVLKEIPSRVHSSCSTTLAAIVRTAIWNQVYHQVIDIEDMMEIYSDGMVVTFTSRFL